MNEKEQELLSKFKWDEDEDEGKDNQTEAVLSEKIFGCAEKIHQYVVDNISLEHFAGDDTIEISVPVSLDPLLESRYNDTYTEESRLVVFDLLRAAFRFKLDEVGFNTAAKINVMMPDRNEQVEQAVKKYVDDMEMGSVISKTGGIKRAIHVTRCDLHDEPSMDVVVTQKVSDGCGSEEIVDTKTESTRQCICAEITFESRRA